MTTNFTIENDNLRIMVASQGAELQSIFSKHLNCELLWQGDASVWPRKAPVLFPIVGRLNNDELKHNDKSYSLTQHGFARDRDFTVVNHSSNQIQLVLQADEQSRIRFPFEFELMISYSLDKNGLKTSYTVRNNSPQVLPYSIGGHPAFNWPLVPGVNKQDHYVEFEKEEESVIRQLENGLLKNDSVPSPVKNKRLSLSNELFNCDALIFDNPKSRQLIYYANNTACIKMLFDSFSQLGIWSKPSADFICLEPWIGYASPIDFDGEFMNKPGIILQNAFSELNYCYDIVVDNFS